MAEAKAGSAVYPIAGRGKGELMIVLRTDAGYAYLADGKRIRVENPKKKKIKHLNVTNFVSEVVAQQESAAENHTVRKELAKLKSI